MRSVFQASTLSGLAGIVIIVLCWHVAVAAGLVSPFLVPPPAEVWRAGFNLFNEERLAHAFTLTLVVTFSATAIAALLGVCGGWLLYRYRLFGMAYESWLGALFSAPLILLYPLFMVIFGRGYTTLVVMGVLAGVIPILMKTREGLAGVRPVLINVARSLNMSDALIFRKVLLPAAVPTIFTGLRLGFIYTMINIVAVEYLANFGGLGFLVGEMYDRFDIPAMYAAMLFVITVSIVGFWSTERLEKWLLKT
ncbi:MAG: ABC transporter permease subunit [Pseudomonadota bacterium]